MLRRVFLTLPLTWLLPPLARAAQSEPELPEDEVEVAVDNGTYVGRFSLLVPVAVPTAWEVLTDFEHMAGFVPNLESSRVLSKENGAVVVAQRGKLEFGPFTLRFESERRVEMHARERLLISRALSGSAKHMLSEMRLSMEGGGTRLDYRVEMVPERWLPASIGVGFMRHELALQFSAMAREMLRRQQSRRSP